MDGSILPVVWQCNNPTTGYVLTVDIGWEGVREREQGLSASVLVVKRLGEALEGACSLVGCLPRVIVAKALGELSIAAADYESLSYQIGGRDTWPEVAKISTGNS